MHVPDGQSVNRTRVLHHKSSEDEGRVGGPTHEEVGGSDWNRV